MIINIEKTNEKVNFKELKDREYFLSGGIVYIKIFSQDLKEYGINNIVNAVSVVNAGLTFFDPNEIVNKTIVQFEK